MDFNNKIYNINKKLQNINGKNNKEIYISVINEYDKIIKSINLTEYQSIPNEIESIETYLLCYKEPFRNYEKNKNLTNILNIYLNTSIIYKQLSLIEENKELKIQYLQDALFLLKTTLHITLCNDIIQMEIVSLYSLLCDSVNDIKISIKLLNEALVYLQPKNSYLIHYNLGFLYSKLNLYQESLIHYKKSIYITTTIFNQDKDKTLINNILVNSINNIACLYRSLKCWNEAVYYICLGLEYVNDDPDLLNNLGTIFTEMRRTDLSKQCFEKAYKMFENSIISNDKKKLKSEILLNLGHMYSYNGENLKAIEIYNESLENYNLIYSFQNKLMNLNYLYYDLNNPLDYIYKQHLLTNSFYKNTLNYSINKSKQLNKTLNIGFVSGDFVEHPVSYFISNLITLLNKTNYNVFCYSQTLIDTVKYTLPNLKFIFNNSTIEACNLIIKDNIDILIDLSGHTANNRLDIFYAKPAPIQISYCGYANTTGLKTIDYRITDKYCDNELSEYFHSEKLLFIDNCFLNYTPTPYEHFDLNKLEKLHKQPFLQNKNFITIGCFNRLNKISDKYIDLCNLILENCPVKFIFKTKALLNENIKQSFLKKFIKSENITILDCDFSHNAHLLQYNNLDLSLDTFPYCGTTTTCESLLMGVPVITLKDSNEIPLHSHNVSTSILFNSNLKEYVFTDIQEIPDFINSLFDSKDFDWTHLKNKTRNTFLNGKVCDSDLFVKNFTNVIQDLL